MLSLSFSSPITMFELVSPASSYAAEGSRRGFGVVEEGGGAEDGGDESEES